MPNYRPNTSFVPPETGQTKRLYSADLFNPNSGAYPIPGVTTAKYMKDPTTGKIPFFDGATDLQWRDYFAGGLPDWLWSQFIPGPNNQILALPLGTSVEYTMEPRYNQEGERIEDEEVMAFTPTNQAALWNHTTKAWQIITLPLAGSNNTGVGWTSGYWNGTQYCIINDNYYTAVSSNGVDWVVGDGSGYGGRRLQYWANKWWSFSGAWGMMSSDGLRWTRFAEGADATPEHPKGMVLGSTSGEIIWVDDDYCYVGAYYPDLMGTTYAGQRIVRVSRSGVVTPYSNLMPAGHLWTYIFKMPNGRLVGMASTNRYGTNPFGVAYCTSDNGGLSWNLGTIDLTAQALTSPIVDIRAYRWMSDRLVVVGRRGSNNDNEYWSHTYTDLTHNSCVLASEQFMASSSMAPLFEPATMLTDETLRLFELSTPPRQIVYIGASMGWFHDTCSQSSIRIKFL